MTTAEFTFGKNGVFQARIQGHAGYCAGGPDIVCAGCSALAYALLQQMRAMEAGGSLLALTVSEDSAKGAFFLRVQSKKQARARVCAAFATICGGYALLAARYPDFVKCVQTGGEKGKSL